MARRRCIAVIGGGRCDAATAEVAEEVGRRLAEAGYVAVTGGLDGVMAAASRGAQAASGLVVGVLPGAVTGDANPGASSPWTVATARCRCAGSS